MLSKLNFALAAILASALVGACAGPAARVADFATQHRLQSLLLDGDGYAHVAYFNQRASSTGVLHVYIEHDGLAWIDNDKVAADPTPHHVLMLAAMAQDSAPSLYLGRPCYFGRSHDAKCAPMLWTHQRYSETVVKAMASALSGFLSTHDYINIVFLGYSGGGALAMLLAERFAQTRAVITIAGNLDTVSWAKIHDYSPLIGSLNPAERDPLPDSILQLHFVGGRDTNISTEMIESISLLAAGSVIMVPKFDHICCWQDWWPNVLEILENRLSTH